MKSFYPKPYEHETIWRWCWELSLFPERIYRYIDSGKLVYVVFITLLYFFWCEVSQVTNHDDVRNLWIRLDWVIPVQVLWCVDVWSSLVPPLAFVDSYCFSIYFIFVIFGTTGFYITRTHVQTFHRIQNLHSADWLLPDMNPEQRAVRLQAIRARREFGFVAGILVFIGLSKMSLLLQ